MFVIDVITISRLMHRGRRLHTHHYWSNSQTMKTSCAALITLHLVTSLCADIFTPEAEEEQEEDEGIRQEDEGERTSLLHHTGIN